MLVSGDGSITPTASSSPSRREKTRRLHVHRDYVEAGALMGYALDLSELFRRLADDVHKILKGAKPGDIPIYQATKFELLINEDGKNIRPDPAPGAARPRRRGDRMSAPGKAGAIQPVEVRPK